MKKYTLKADKKRQYHRKSTMSKAEIMVIMILFHDSGYLCLKHFYIEKVCRHMRHLFPKVVSYNPMEQREQKPNLFGLCRNIVQTRADSSLLGYAECSRYSTKLIATEEDDSQPIRGTWKGGSHPFGSIHQEGAARKMYWHKFRGQHSP